MVCQTVLRQSFATVCFLSFYLHRFPLKLFSYEYFENGMHENSLSAAQAYDKADTNVVGVKATYSKKHVGYWINKKFDAEVEKGLRFYQPRSGMVIRKNIQDQ